MVLEEIDETNNLIKENSIESGRKIYLSDPNTVDKESLIQSMPSGNLSTNGQEQIVASFFAPYGTKKIIFSCRGGGALTPAFTCRTHAFGKTNTRTSVGNFLTWIDIEVPLAAANVTVNIDFRTTDKNGGMCNWKASS